MLYIGGGVGELALYTMGGLGRMAIGGVVLFFILIAGSIMLRK